MADLKRDETPQLRAEAAALRAELTEAGTVLRDAMERTAKHKSTGVPGNEPYCECDLCLFIMDNVDAIERLAANAEPCGTCGGTGDLIEMQCYGGPAYETREPCPDCAEGEA